MPVSDEVAFGNSESQLQVDAVAGEELYLVVVTTPDVYDNWSGLRYNYEYSLEVITPHVGARLINSDVEGVGVKEKELVADEITSIIYPNPTNGQFTIPMPSNSDEPVEVMLVNLQGKVFVPVYSQESDRVNVEFEGPAGIYSVHVITKDHVRSNKIIKQ